MSISVWSHLLVIRIRIRIRIRIYSLHPYEHNNILQYLKLKGLEAKGPFLCLGLKVSIKRAYQVQLDYSFLWLVKYYLRKRIDKTMDR